MADDAPFDSLWDYNDPAGTEQKFRAIDPSSLSRSHRLQLQTQIARTLGLQGKFDDAHALLDSVHAELTPADSVERVRYLLERGRAFNSSGKKSEAMPLFVEATNLANGHRLDFYSVDAMHMVAIAEGDPQKQLEWNFAAMQLAEASTSDRARNWLGSLYHNVGWTYFEQRKFDYALHTFKKALAFREKSGKADLIDVANYCIAKTLRMMNRIDEAMQTLNRLPRDGFVCEELGECHINRGESDLARAHFKQALELLSQDAWFVSHEVARLERIRQLSEER